MATDAIDFEKRSWVPYSGWPFGLEEIKPWYSAAWKLLEVDSPSQQICASGLATAPWKELVVRHWSFDRKFDRFGYETNRDLVANPSLTLVLHATVREIVLAASGGQIDFLDVRGPGEKRLRVEAKTYVLAAGGLENPRLLIERLFNEEGVVEDFERSSRVGRRLRLSRGVGQEEG